MHGVVASARGRVCANPLGLCRDPGEVGIGRPELAGGGLVLVRARVELRAPGTPREVAQVISLPGREDELGAHPALHGSHLAIASFAAPGEYRPRRPARRGRDPEHLERIELEETDRVPLAVATVEDDPHRRVASRLGRPEAPIDEGVLRHWALIARKARCVQIGAPHREQGCTDGDDSAVHVSHLLRVGSTAADERTPSSEARHLTPGVATGSTRAKGGANRGGLGARRVLAMASAASTG